MPKAGKLSGQEEMLSFELIGTLNPNELIQKFPEF